MNDTNVSSPVAAASPAPLLSEAQWLWVRRLAALAAALGMVACALVLTTDAATSHRIMVPGARHRFPHWVRGAFDGLVGHITLLRFLQVMLAMLICWVVLYLCAAVVPVRWMAVAVVVLNAIFLLGPPILSADVFGYIDFARMGVLHHLNPYVHDGGRVVSDPV